MITTQTNAGIETNAASRPLWLKAAPVIFLLLWAGGFIFLKLGLKYVEPLTFLTLRFAGVIVLLIIPYLILRPQLPRGLMAWLHLGIVGLLLQVGYSTGVYLSIKFGLSAGAVSLITSQQPILIGLLAPIIAGERVTWVRWIGLICGVGGAMMVIASKSHVDVTSPLGLGFAVMALISLTGGTLWEKRFGASGQSTPVHPIVANLVQYAVALIVTAPLAFLLEPMRVTWSGEFFASLAYLTIGPSIIALTLLLAMIRHGEASRVSALFFLVPPATVIFAFQFLGETIPVLAWPGMALAAAGLYLVMKDRQKA